MPDSVKGFNGKNQNNMYFLTVIFASIFLSSFGILVQNVFAAEVVATIPVGNAPTYVATNPNTNKIYVSNQYSNNISVIDGATNKVINTIPVGMQPTDIKVNPTTNMIYVANYHSGTVSVIDGNADTVVNTISGVLRPWGIGVNPDTNLIYVAGYGNGNYVYVINGTTNTIVTTVQFASNEIPSQPTVNPATNMIYVPTVCSYCHQSYIAVIDGHNNTRVMNIPAGMSPNYAEANPVTNMIYVSDDANTYQIDVINGSSNSLVATIPMAGVGPIAVNPDTNLIYVVCCNGNTVSTINGTDNNMLDKVQVGSEPFDIAVNPTTNMIYVVNVGDNTVSVIDGNTSSPDFVISSSSPNLNIPVGSSRGSTITTSSFYGFSGTVSLSASAPSTLTASLNPSSVTVSSGSSDSATLTVTALPSTNPGQYTVTVTGTNGSLTHSTYVVVQVYVVPPSAPTGLSATAASSSQINLSWTAPSNNGGSAITGYEIEHSTDGGSTWSTIVSNTGNTNTSYSDTGLAHSTTYTYRVSAINSVGTGLSSNTASATTLNTIPTQPAGLTATAVSSSQINLRWNAPSDNGGTPIIGYMIERSTNNGSTWNTVVSNTDSTDTTYSNTGLSSNTTYYYRVSAINDVGTSNPSNTASATTPLLSVAGTNVGPVSTTLP